MTMAYDRGLAPFATLHFGDFTNNLLSFSQSPNWKKFLDRIYDPLSFQQLTVVIYFGASTFGNFKCSKLFSPQCTFHEKL